MFERLTDFFRRIKNQRVPTQVVERDFHAIPIVSREMEDNIALWYAMFINHPPWENCNVRPLGLPGAIARELARPVLVELGINISGGKRGAYLHEQIQRFQEQLKPALELGLSLGGVAFRPYPDGGKILVDATSATAFDPTAFDGTGKATAGVFRELKQVGKQWYVRLEYHSFQMAEDGATVYLIQNRAYQSDGNGTVGRQIPLNALQEWTDIPPEAVIRDIERPLFVYFKPPAANGIDPNSPIGVSLYGGAAVELIRQADEQWERIWWEYESGQRKIFMDGTETDAKTFGHKRLFEFGPFSASGDVFKEFTPDFRDEPLYRGFQNSLKQIEFNVGLSYGILSDPQSIEKTATEIKSSKQRMYVTVSDIQAALEDALDGLIYAMNVYCDLYQLAPAGGYEVSYEWGDGVVQDEEARQKELAEMRNDVAAGLVRPELYVSKKYGVTEREALAMMPGMETLTTEPQNDVE